MAWPFSLFVENIAQRSKKVNEHSSFFLEMWEISPYIWWTLKNPSTDPATEKGDRDNKERSRSARV
jgi:hypothetical protein